MIRRTCIRSALALASALLLSPAAHAQAFRAYLAPTGLDTNPCSLQQPCRLLPAALTAVASGGEIWILGSGNYNTAPVSVTKSVTILAVPGVVGSLVAASGGNAIDIATPSIRVALRNMVIVPLTTAPGVHGIMVSAGAALSLENCLISGLAGTGIVVNAASASLRVVDSTIQGNLYGIWLEGGARAVIARANIGYNGDAAVVLVGSGANETKADIAYSTLHQNKYGPVAFSGHASGTVVVSVRESQIVQNSFEGLRADSALGGTARITATNNVVANNFGTGMFAQGAGAKILASGNTVTNNDQGFYIDAGAIESTGNNVIRDNAAASTGSLSAVTTQ